MPLATGRPRALLESLKIGVVYKSLITQIVQSIVQKETITDSQKDGHI